MSRQVKRWTHEQRQSLLLGVGTYGLEWLKRNSGNRSRKAIYDQMHDLWGKGGLTRGSYPLQKVIDETSYNREQLIRAGKALQQRWARTSKRGTFLLTEDQIEQIVAWLRKDYWCSKLCLYGCVRCGTIQRRPHGFGCCERCYFVLRRLALSVGLPFSITKLHGYVLELQKLYSGPDRDFLDLLEARLDRRWAPLDLELERLGRLSAGKLCGDGGAVEAHDSVDLPDRELEETRP